MTATETVTVEIITNAKGREVRHLAACRHVTRARNAGKPVDGPVDMEVREAWGGSYFEGGGADVADCLAFAIGNTVARIEGVIA